MSDFLNHRFVVELTYTTESETKHLSLSSPYEDDDLEVNWNVNAKNEASSLFLTIIPKLPLNLDLLDLVFDYPVKTYPRVFVNGYQSWTESHERSIKEKLPHISALAKRLNDTYQFSKYGDYEFVNINKAPGYFHGFTYAYLRKEDKIHLMGSLNERTGFTIFEIQAPKNKIIIHKDVAGVRIDSSFGMDLFFIEATDDLAFDAWFSAMSIEKPLVKPRMGWTSWYNYYQNINQDIVDRNLKAAAELARKMDIIQIDDGYQTAVGDWLSVDPVKFPQGMKAVADAIKAQGSLPGLWLAPFVVQKSAQLIIDHPDWVLKDSFGNFEIAGYGWGQNYALDLENKEVRDYLRHVFEVVLNDWGFGLVKLDFLYASSLGHHPSKTRGQRSAEGMDFLRSCVKDKMILGCGACLGTTFGKVEYCRIGPDVSLDWDGPWYYQLIHRERVSTKNAVLNAIGRRHLDQRGFLNDPDVFLLRNDNIQMSSSQKEILAQVNRLFGSLLFTSDLISDYDENQRKQWAQTSALSAKKIHSVTYPHKDAVEVRYQENNREWLALINLSKKPIRFENGRTITPYTIDIQII